MQTILKKDWRHHPFLGETIKGELVLAQCRCPNCCEWMTVTNRDLRTRDGVVLRENKKHGCGLKRMYFKLENYKKHPYL